jgi:hypothetical protein
MNWHRWLATLLITLALTACAQGGQIPYAPYSPHDRGGNGGGAVACSGQGQSDPCSPLLKAEAAFEPKKVPEPESSELGLSQHGR